MTTRVPHWKYLKKKIEELRGTWPDRTHNIIALGAQCSEVIVPAKHCDEIIATIDERLEHFMGESGCQMRGALESMKQSLLEQKAEQEKAPEAATV